MGTWRGSFREDATGLSQLPEGPGAHEVPHWFKLVLVGAGHQARAIGSRFAHLDNLETPHGPVTTVTDPSWSRYARNGSRLFVQYFVQYVRPKCHPILRPISRPIFSSFNCSSFVTKKDPKISDEESDEESDHESDEESDEESDKESDEESDD